MNKFKQHFKLKRCFKSFKNFNEVIKNIKPNSQHIFQSLTAFERKHARILASDIGMFHWKNKLKVRHCYEEVLIISNDPADKDKKDIQKKKKQNKNS